MSADDPGPIRRGQRLTARWLDGLRQLILRAGRVSAEAPLELLTLDGRRWLRWARARPILARLLLVNPATRAYSWAEVQQTGGATYATLAGGRSGTANAFEANLSVNLPIGTNGGSVVELRPGYNGEDYRFQWHRRGGDSVVHCGSLPTIILGASFGCCPNSAATFTVSYNGSTLATCTGSALPGGGIGCSVQVDLPPGTIVDWSISASPWPAKSGKLTIPACGSSVGAGYNYLLQDLVTGGVTCTDPDGNAISMTRTATDTWTGSQVYDRTDTKAGHHLFTVNYTFTPCRLDMSSTFGVFTGPITMSLSKTPLWNIIPWTAGYTEGAALPDWTAPTDDVSTCDPLLMAFSSWWNKYVVGGGFGGRPTLFKRAGTCGGMPAIDGSIWFPYFNVYIALTGGQWHPFTCNSTWTVTL